MSRTRHIAVGLFALIVVGYSLAVVVRVMDSYNLQIF